MWRLQFCQWTARDLHLVIPTKLHLHPRQNLLHGLDHWHLPASAPQKWVAGAFNSFAILKVSRVGSHLELKYLGPGSVTGNQLGSSLHGSPRSAPPRLRILGPAINSVVCFQGFFFLFPHRPSKAGARLIFKRGGMTLAPLSQAANVTGTQFVTSLALSVMTQ